MVANGNELYFGLPSSAASSSFMWAYQMRPVVMSPDERATRGRDRRLAQTPLREVGRYL
jgi:hypothetical protein